MLPVVNPANGRVLGSVPDMEAKDVEQAVEAAHTAFNTWKDTTAKVLSNTFYIILNCILIYWE